MPDAVVTLALRTLRAHAEGELRFDERQQRTKFVIDPGSGRLAMPVAVAALEALDTVLFIPEERDGAMELLLTIEPMAAYVSDDALVDRWRIYHGEPEEMNWALCSIDAARHEGFVVDGEALMQPNSLAADEPKLCKLLNEAGRGILAAITFKHADRRIEEPVAVGVDDFGIDVRARFEIVRIEAPEQFGSADNARRVINAWIDEASGA